VHSVCADRAFLSCSADGLRVDLWYRDDGSGRQQWKLEPVGNSDSTIFRLRVADGVPGNRSILQCVDGGAGLILTDRDDSLCYFSVRTPAALRPVHFAVTADPQIENNNGARYDICDKTFRTIARSLFSDPSMRGLIVAGDLTQNTRPYDELSHYAATLSNYGDLGPNIDCLPYTYDGLGNHDLASANFWQQAACVLRRDECVDSGQLHDCVRRERDAVPLAVGDIHYAWQWADISFVQLNLFPGAESRRDLSPEGSLDFLRSVKNKLTKGKVVLIHHYGFDLLSTGKANPDEVWWLEEDRVAYWNEICDLGVIAIFTGHVHYYPGKDDPQVFFFRPAACTQGPKWIPAFVSGATLNGVYLDVQIDDLYLNVTQMNSDGHPARQTYRAPLP
jgi:hypothetical protein